MYARENVRTYLEASKYVTPRVLESLSLFYGDAAGDLICVRSYQILQFEEYSLCV